MTIRQQQQQQQQQRQQHLPTRTTRTKATRFFFVAILAAAAVVVVLFGSSETSNHRWEMTTITIKSPSPTLRNNHNHTAIAFGDDDDDSKAFEEEEANATAATTTATEAIATTTTTETNNDYNNNNNNNDYDYEAVLKQKYSAGAPPGSCYLGWTWGNNHSGFFLEVEDSVLHPSRGGRYRMCLFKYFKHYQRQREQQQQPQQQRQPSGRGIDFWEWLDGSDENNNGGAWKNLDPWLEANKTAPERCNDRHKDDRYVRLFTKNETDRYETNLVGSSSCSRSTSTSSTSTSSNTTTTTKNTTTAFDATSTVTEIDDDPNVLSFATTNIRAVGVATNRPLSNAGRRVFVWTAPQEKLFVFPDVDGHKHTSPYPGAVPVWFAGEMDIDEDGCVTSVNTESGHYLPTAEHARRFADWMRKNTIMVPTKTTDGNDA